jgi:hypothetical protein
MKNHKQLQNEVCQTITKPMPFNPEWARIVFSVIFMALCLLIPAMIANI